MNTTIARYDSGKMKHTLTSGKHTIVGDIDTASGGEDTGPSPHDLIAMSLASCTSMTVRLYTQRKQWDLQNTIVTVDIVNSPEGVLFNRKIEIVGNLDGEQRQRVLDIANKCPIHKLLSGKIEVKTELVGK